MLEIKLIQDPDVHTLFTKTMEQYNISVTPDFQPGTYIITSRKGKEVAALKKFKRRALILLNNGTNRRNKGYISIPKQKQTFSKTAPVSVDNILQYI